MKIKLEKIKSLLKKFPRLVAGNFLISLIFCFVLSFLFYFFLFKFSMPTQQENEIKISEFNVVLYQRVEKKFKEREIKFEEIDKKRYSNIFK